MSVPAGTSASPELTPATAPTSQPRDAFGVSAAELTRVELAMVAITIAVYASSVVRSVAPGGFNDDAVYLALGRAIADGQGYRSIYLVGEPLHVKFPPALPALLAAMWKVGGSVEAVHMLAVTMNIAACALAAAELWWLARVRLAASPVAVAAAQLIGRRFAHREACDSPDDALPQIY